MRLPTFKGLALVATLFSINTFSQTDKLQLENEAYRASFDRTICTSFTNEDMGQPSAFTDRGVQFEYLASDAGLDNLVLALSYKEGETTCSYSAHFVLDIVSKLGNRVESLAVSTKGEGSCAEGKAFFDGLVDFMPYFHKSIDNSTQIGFGFAVEGTQDICGENARQVLTVFKHQ